MSMKAVDRFLVAGVLQLALAFGSARAHAQDASRVAGHVTDDSHGPLPGVTIQLNDAAGSRTVTSVTDASGAYEFRGVPPGRYGVTFALINFTTSMRRGVTVGLNEAVTVDATLHVAISADVTVTGKNTFRNLADISDPAGSLVGVALAASQGAIVSSQLETRAVMRSAEVLEAVPGLIITQHSGEGKANQYYLRGFNLDHGTDFATTVAGVPVNMPTHGHGQGYSDLNFLMPELVGNIQYSKGPYYADQGDFSAAGSASINYANRLERPLLSLGAGQQGWSRLLVAASPRVGAGHLLMAFEANHSDGPWLRPDAYRRLNGVITYSQGNAQNGFAVTAMGYDGRWNSSDQIPERAVSDGRISRYGHIDPTDGAQTYRYSLSADLQRSSDGRVDRATAYLMAYGLDLFSNFTYFLEDPVRGDQFEQQDARIVAGGRLTRRRIMRWANRNVQNTFGVQVRHDAIGTVALFKTQARRRLQTVLGDSADQTSGALFAQNEVQLTARLRTTAGLRLDAYHFRVNSDDPVNSGTHTAAMLSPKLGVILGPWQGTEFYANAGGGFHSNDARGATIREDPLTHARADRVTPLVRATGAEVGARSILVPHVQSTVALWLLDLASELVFSGDAGTTEAGRPSRRVGLEWANYWRPVPWLTVDADLAFSRARFTNADPVGDRIPGAAGTVASLGTALQHPKGMFGDLRVRYFGPRPLVATDLVRSPATHVVNAQAGYRFSNGARLGVETFNLFNTRASDVDYYYISRLPGEPSNGVADIHTHPITPRTARLTLQLAF